MSRNEFCCWHCSAASLRPCAVKKDHLSTLRLPSALKSGRSSQNHEKGSTATFVKGIFPIKGTVDFLREGKITELSEFMFSKLLL